MGKLIIVRHGQTQMNVEGIFFGKLDPGLNEMGRVQSKKAGDILKKHGYDAIYSSDLVRASETAELVNYLKLPIKFDKRLQEIDFGIFEGLSYKEIKEKYPVECKKSKNEWKTFDFVTGESLERLQSRAVEFVESLDKTKNNLVVTHWGVINCILSWYFSDKLESYWKYSVENGGICIIEFADDFPILKGLNIG
ncbi:histidine phosphatase family protein [Fusobacterium varium]|uniref:Histidine phosphatase family protein n=1 Tax=Fusobacterium varium ATCC 27725 TaxID=469618 RepID=A0ABM6U5A3_FUSVA|nr:histidine phosphatase family protein [Fusobacterium varium]AVQ31529.1 histidine phosphatase family protein [Fusobacterium varium ATCC 27725]EES62861.1 phosphoglycerate mutase family protein [Fusobacterium varium ATCC 27725]VEH39691.1 Alpha-ribazole phosphatase [Fusobacterium varium]